MHTSRPKTQDASGHRITRRAVVVGAATALVTASVGTRTAQAAPDYSVIPRLPGEVWRADTRTTRVGRKSFETVDLVVGGDRARLYVPRARPPGATTPTGVVWFYHSNGSTHTSMDGAYAYPGMLAVDWGAICVCPNYGGSLWTSQPALDHQVTWARYVSSVFRVGASFARANSGGGALMVYAYARDMVPALRGVYLANASYDMEDLYARDPGRIGPVYGHDPAVVAATNPARLPQSAWTGKRLKTVVSEVDPVLPPSRHGSALAAHARPVAVDVRVRSHDQGHTVPGWTHSDMISTFSSWV